MDNPLARLETLHGDGNLILSYKAPRELELAEQIEQEIKEGERLAEQLFKAQKIKNKNHSHSRDNSSDLNAQDTPPHVRSESNFQKDFEHEYRSRLAEETAILKNVQTQIYNSTDPLENRDLTAELITESKRKIIENALKIICRNLTCQSAAIFLFSKTGRLERFGIRGWDRNGRA
jgi:hypothetical protein